MPTCYVCKGSKVCSACRGRGYLWKYPWEHAGHEDGRKICGACNGTGKCSICGGSGKVKDDWVYRTWMEEEKKYE